MQRSYSASLSFLLSGKAVAKMYINLSYFTTIKKELLITSINLSVWPGYRFENSVDVRGNGNIHTNMIEQRTT